MTSGGADHSPSMAGSRTAGTWSVDEESNLGRIPSPGTVSSYVPQQRAPELLSDFINQNTLGQTTGLCVTAFPYSPPVTVLFGKGPTCTATLPAIFSFCKEPVPFLCPHLTPMLWDVTACLSRTPGKLQHFCREHWTLCPRHKSRAWGYLLLPW